MSENTGVPTPPTVPRVRIGSSSGPRPKRGRIAESSARREVLDAQVEEQRRATREGLDRTPPPVAPPTEPVPEREDVESIELALPNGKVVEVAPPMGVSLTIRLLHYYKDRDSSVADELITKALMCVRKVDGLPYPMITNEIERDKLGHMLGDDGITIVRVGYAKYWPPLRLAELPLLKKNVRGQ